jgi:hypothetical protein
VRAHRLGDATLQLLNSYSRVAKQLPHITSPQQSPTLPIDGLMPAILQRSPNSIAVH